jgi:ADP-ribosylation factor 1/2
MPPLTATAHRRPPPTRAGFNVESVEYKSLSFTVWDVGGQSKLRPLWRHYYRGSRGLIYLVDSNDTKRMEEAAETLAAMLEDEELSSVPVLVLANKQDLPRALPPAAVAEKLKMSSLRGRAWHVQGCNALTGDGVYEGMDWMARTLKEKR